MKYAIVEIGGHQVWVEEGQHFITNRISIEPGTKISINRVLLVNTEENLQFGHPYLSNSKVEGQIMEHLRGSKVIVYKMKSKKK
jgi:large subunit ribosomal protein L21